VLFGGAFVVRCEDDCQQADGGEVDCYVGHRHDYEITSST
jgi:hypothetical protein